MNLFVAPLEKVTERDVEDFLGINLPESQRLSEGPRLDFNTLIPENIGEDVAAFANASGGLIFIGVQSVKTKQNIPVALPGVSATPDLETQVSAKIDATVRPRPDFQPKTVPTSKGTYLIVIRVRKGTYPPYEYQRGDRVSIPIRAHDRKRGATVREIDSLFRERAVAGENPESSILHYINDQNLEPKKPQTINQRESEVGDSDYQRIVVVPQPAAILRLDGAFESEFDRMVFKYFPYEPSSWDHYRRGEFFQIEARYRDPKFRWHHIWRVYRTGTLAYAGSLTDDFPEGKPIGDLASDLLSMCMLAHRLYSDNGIFGDVHVGHLVQSVTAKFLPKFPTPDFNRDYDTVRGIAFAETRLVNTNRSFAMTMMDTSELNHADDHIAEVLVYNLRELTGVRVNHETLMEAIRTLSQRLRDRIALAKA